MQKSDLILPEWSSFLVRQVDTAFAAGAHLAAFLTALAGLETSLRAAYAVTGNEPLAAVIDQAHIAADLKDDLHILRRYRNRWVHGEHAWEEGKFLENPDLTREQLEEMAFFAARTLRRALFEEA